MLKIVIISRSFDLLERKLLVKNYARAKRVFGEVAIAYVLGERQTYDSAPVVDSNIKFYLILNSPVERNAALSRGAGYDALRVAGSDLVLFLDGDMLVTEEYLEYLRDLSREHTNFLSLCSRVDIRCAGEYLHRRQLNYVTEKNGRFRKLYGSMAVRGICFERYNVMTHDMEEQWFLRMLESDQGLHLSFDRVGILHFDRFAGVDRKLRYLTSSRGVGIWQGMFRDESLKRIILDTMFVLQQKDSTLDLLKLLASSIIALPKLLLFRMPRKLNYMEISDDIT